MRGERGRGKGRKGVCVLMEENNPLMAKSRLLVFS